MSGPPRSRGTKIARALISVHDKTGVVELAAALDAQGVEILSTGGRPGSSANRACPSAKSPTSRAFPRCSTAA